MTGDVSAIREFLCPPGFTRKDYVSRGTNGRVFLKTASQTVVKIANGYDQDDQAALAVEQAIYERLQRAGGHIGILQYYGPYESGIRLEYASNRSLAAYLKDHPRVDIKQRIQWALQVTSALSFIHSHFVIHGDLCLNNVFLTSTLDAKLADFGGSSMDGSDLLACVTESHEFPGPLLSIQADVFALGSTIFEIMAGQRPYQNQSAREIVELYKKHEFPDTRFLGPIGTVVIRCWQARHATAENVFKDIQAIQSLSFRDSCLRDWRCLCFVIAIAVGALTLISN